MDSIDIEYYRFQTKIRNVLNRHELEILCRSETKRIQKVLSDVVQDLQRVPGALALDAPCGYGNLLYLYESNSIKSVGMDLDSEQVRLANMLGLPASVSNIFSLDEVCRYDSISSFDFIEHVDKSDALKILKIFHRALKDGGWLLLRTPCADTPYGLRDFAEDPTHKWIGTTTCVGSMLKICGFSEIEFREDWPSPQRYVALRGVVAKLLRKIRRWTSVLTGYGYPVCMSSSMIVVARK